MAQEKEKPLKEDINALMKQAEGQLQPVQMIIEEIDKTIILYEKLKERAEGSHREEITKKIEKWRALRAEINQNCTSYKNIMAELQTQRKEVETIEKEKMEMAEDLAAYMAYQKAQGVTIKTDLEDDGDKATEKLIQAMPEALEILKKIDIKAIKKRMQRAPYKGRTIDELLSIPGGKSLAQYQKASSDMERSAIKYKAFFENNEITLYHRLIWGAGYRTRRKAAERLNKHGARLASKQEYLSIPTIKPYTNSFRPGGSTGTSGAGVQFVKDTIEKKQALIGQQMELADFADVEQMRLPDTTSSEGKKQRGLIDYNEALLHYVLSCFRDEMKKNGRAPQYIGIRRSDLAANHKDKNGKRSPEELVKDLTRYQTAFQKANDGSYYAVLITAGYNPQSDSFIFASPYMQQLLFDIEEASIERDKNGKPRKTKTGSIKRKIAFVEDVASSDLKNAKNQEAAADVIEIVKIIAMSGKSGTPNISAAELIERNEIFKRRYMESSNQHQLLKRHFITVWKYLNEYAGARLRAKYPGIKLPNGEKVGAEWIPTPGTLKTTIFRFPHE